MAVVAHAFPNLDQQLGSKLMNITSAGDTLGVLLIGSGTVTWNATSQAYTYVSDFLSGLTEVSTSGTGYTRKNLSSVSLATTGATSTLTCANIAWTSASFTAVYACFYDNTPGTDGTRQLICYWDFGGSQTVSASTFTLQIAGTGLATWTTS